MQPDQNPTVQPNQTSTEQPDQNAIVRPDQNATEQPDMDILPDIPMDFSFDLDANTDSLHITHLLNDTPDLTELTSTPQNRRDIIPILLDLKRQQQQMMDKLDAVLTVCGYRGQGEHHQPS